MKTKKGGWQKGFTLLELMFTMLLFPLLFLSVYGLTQMASVVFNLNDANARLNQNCIQVLRSVSREIGQTTPPAPFVSPSHLRLTVDANGNSVVIFQVPVDWDNDGDSVTGALSPQTEWGAYDDVGTSRDGRLGGWVRYQVVNNQLIREVLDATMNPLQNSARVIASNVNQFLAASDPSAMRVLVLTLGLRTTDVLGQSGRQRVLNATFTNRTLLRNTNA